MMIRDVRQINFIGDFHGLSVQFPATDDKNALFRLVPRSGHLLANALLRSEGRRNVCFRVTTMLPAFWQCPAPDRFKSFSDPMMTVLTRRHTRRKNRRSLGMCQGILLPLPMVPSGPTAAMSATLVFMSSDVPKTFHPDAGSAIAPGGRLPRLTRPMRTHA